MAADASGRFEMPGLRPGRYRVVARALGRTTEWGEVTVADGAVAQVAMSVGFREV